MHRGSKMKYFLWEFDLQTNLQQVGEMIYQIFFYRELFSYYILLNSNHTLILQYKNPEMPF